MTAPPLDAADEGVVDERDSDRQPIARAIVRALKHRTMRTSPVKF